MVSLEKIYYESLPAVYFAIAGLGLYVDPTNKVTIVAALALFYCACTITDWRIRSRRNKRFKK